MASEYDIINREHKKISDTKGARQVVVLDSEGNEVSQFGADPVGVKDSSGNPLNPATEENQASILAELQKKADSNETQPVIGVVYLYASDGTALNHSGGNLLVNVQNFAIGQFGDTDTTASNLTSGLTFSELFGYDATSGKWVRIRADSDKSLMVSPRGLSTPTTTAVTLTTADTVYKLPGTELTGRKTIIIYNVSDTSVYIGSSSVTTTNGILLPAGGTFSLDCEKDLYAVCGTDGKIINVLELS